MFEPAAPRPAETPSPAAQADRDLRLLCAAVGLCLLVGLVAVTAAATTSATWPTVLTLAALALASCWIVGTVRTAHTRQSPASHPLPTPPGVGYRGDDNNPSDAS